ncbi:MAG TPA: dTDP-6-deoxy-L-hexose 3-O-methyltransferase, partial [Euryarchaeota archaeon]|nr:dTDP-6-deoxy-L-hexose 3-O-methyltransferase [Euryarchaeota archaeon]
FERSFEYENNFYHSSDITRIGKILAHYELYKMVLDVPGAIVECGVFKGTSLIRFATFRELFGNPFSKQIIGFDTFAEFPETNFEEDKKMRQYHLDTAGGESISSQQLLDILKHKSIDKNVELVEGDITKTLPEYVEAHPELKISLLNLDTDIYEPSKVILDCLYPRLVKGAVLLLDDYGTFPGETKAVDEYFADKNEKIQKLPFCMSPCYLIKE